MCIRDRYVRFVCSVEEYWIFSTRNWCSVGKLVDLNAQQKQWKTIIKHRNIRHYECHAKLWHWWFVNSVSLCKQWISVGHIILVNSSCSSDINTQIYFLYILCHFFSVFPSKPHAALHWLKPEIVNCLQSTDGHCAEYRTAQQARQKEMIHWKRAEYQLQL